MLRLLLLISIVCSTQSWAQTPNFQDFKFSGSMDFVLPQYLSSGDHPDNNLSLRALDLMFYGPIDPYFDARITLAGHEEDGEFHIGIHEAFASSSKIIPYSRFRLGQFLMDIGRLNTFHQHDWPFTTAPLIHRSIFGDEGVSGLGAEYTLLVPTEHFIEVTLGVVNGNKWGETNLVDPALTPEADSKADFPTHYIHPKTYFEFSEGRGLMLGATALRRWHPADQDVSIFGVDATFKSRDGKILRWLVQSELWSENTKRPGSINGKQLGGYLYAQYGWNEQWSSGLRYDNYDGKNVDLEGGARDSSTSYAIVPTVTYKTSEMSMLRASYSYEVQKFDVEADRSDSKIELQFVYVLGSHPVHDF